MNQDDNAPDAPPPGGDDAGTEAAKLIVPFEDSSKDFFTGLFETIKLVMFQPTHFFKNYKLDGPISRPLLFAVMIGWTASIINAIWVTLIQQSVITVLQEHMPEIEGVNWDQLVAQESAFDFALKLFIAPIQFIIGIFIISGLYHLCLMMVKGANKNFQTTFHVVAYGITVAYIAVIIPICGGLIVVVYALILSVIGLMEGHRTDSGKAVFAVFASFILCCACIILIFTALVGSGFPAGTFNSAS
jgi:hypothetical protein